MTDQGLTNLQLDLFDAPTRLPERRAANNAQVRRLIRIAGLLSYYAHQGDNIHMITLARAFDDELDRLRGAP